MVNRQDMSAAAAQRARPRHKLFQPTTMAVATALERVHLLDLSAQGALVHAAAPPAKGTVVRLECAGRMRMARVMWIDGSRFGVAFALALSGDQVAAVVADRRPIVPTRIGAVA